MEIDLVLRGVSGLASMVFFAGMLYMAFIVMRVRRGRPSLVFFWAVMGQAGLLALMTVMSVFMKLFGYSMINWGGGGSVDWIGLTSSILEGALVVCGFIAAVALLMTTRRE